MLSSRYWKICWLLVSLGLGCVQAAWAAESDNAQPIRALTNQKQHFEAMKQFYDRGTRASLSDTLAAAESAWALGLVSEAEHLWLDSLMRRDFNGDDRSRAALSLAILRLQEKRPEEARTVAEQQIGQLPQSELRTQFRMIVAESLVAQKAYSLAEGYYKRALDESAPEQQSEIRYFLGECEQALGITDEARKAFAGVEVDSQYGLYALRQLLALDFSQRQYDGVRIWFNEGREHFPRQFDDAESRYMYISALLELGETGKAEKELADLRTQFSENDTWYLLAQSTYESKMFVSSGQR